MGHAETSRLGAAIGGEIARLRRYALGLCGDIALADDLVQDAVERALRHAGALARNEALGGWMRTILYRGFLDHLRRSRGRASLDLDELDAAGVLRADPPDLPGATDLSRALATLTPEHRQVLLLVCVEGLSYAEAAAEAGVKIGTVMSRLARAREQVRHAMERGNGGKAKASANGPASLPGGSAA